MTQAIGDLARFIATRTRVAQASQDLARTTSEVSSGIKSDIGGALKGDFTRLTSVERGLRLNDSYMNGANLAKGFFAGMQNALGRGQDVVVELGPRLISNAGTGQTSQLLIVATEAESGFEQFVGALNTQIGGRSAFSGTATDALALVPAGDMLADLELLVAGAPDAATMITLVNDYFTDPAGGYETTAYQGDAAPQSGYTIGEGNRVSSEITALDPAIRRILSGLALGTLLAREVGPLDPESRSDLGRQAGEWMQEGNDATTLVRAGLGVSEAQVDTALTQIRATETALGTARSELIVADPFEAAIELQSVETRLETLYLMTARLQRLTLAEYL
ncbi:MAG: flagellin [Pseudomonadota bacterium]